MSGKYPLFLFTNDDGIDSPGLWAAVKAFEGLGDRLVVAPKDQQSGAGHSLRADGRDNPGRLYPVETPDNETWTAYAVNGTPANAVQYGALEVADRLPSLVVSGINYGENAGSGITVSGTIGAALEAAGLGFPALAVSQQTPIDLHMSYSKTVDFSLAAHYARVFGRWLLETTPLPDDLHLLKIDIPVGATMDTPWKITRISRFRVYWPVMPERASLDEDGRVGYKLGIDPAAAEPDSDIYTILHEGFVSITPMSLDMTARIDFDHLRVSIAKILPLK